MRVEPHRNEGVFGAYLQPFLLNAERALHSRWLLIAAALICMAFSAWSLQTYPAVDSDEALFSSIGHSFYEHGRFLILTSPGSVEARTNVLYGRLYAVMIGMALELFGVSVFAARTLSLLGALISGLLVKNIAQAWGLGRPAQLGAAVLFWTSWRVLFAGHSARPEMWIVVSGLLLVYLHLRSRRTPTVRQYLIFGFVATYLLDIHVPVIFYSATVTALVLLDVIRGQTGIKQLLAYALGAGLGIAAWVALWVLPIPEITLQPMTGGPLSTTSSSSIWRSWSFISQGTQFISWLFYNYLGSTRAGGIEVLLVVAAMGYLLLRRSPAGNYLLLSLGLLIVSLFVTPYRHSQHAVAVIPITSLIVAHATERLVAASTHLRGLKLVVLLLPLLGLYVSGQALLSWQSQTLSYAQYASALHKSIPPGSTILGEGSWWFEFKDSIYLSDASLSSGREPVEEKYNGLLESMKVRRVQFILYDGRLSSYWSEPYAPAEVGLYPVYEQFLEDHCSSVGEVDLPYVGVERGGPANKHTTIWQCDFSSP